MWKEKSVTDIGRSPMLAVGVGSDATMLEIVSD